MPCGGRSASRGAVEQPVERGAGLRVNGVHVERVGRPDLVAVDDPAEHFGAVRRAIRGGPGVGRDGCGRGGDGGRHGSVPLDENEVEGGVEVRRFGLADVGRVHQLHEVGAAEREQVGAVGLHELLP